MTFELPLENKRGEECTLIHYDERGRVVSVDITCTTTGKWTPIPLIQSENAYADLYRTCQNELDEYLRNKPKAEPEYEKQFDAQDVFQAAVSAMNQVRENLRRQA
jgi:uncharacterized protein YuzE